MLIRGLHLNQAGENCRACFDAWDESYRFQIFIWRMVGYAGIGTAYREIRDTEPILTILPAFLLRSLNIENRQ